MKLLFNLSLILSFIGLYAYISLVIAKCCGIGNTENEQGEYARPEE